VCNIATYSTGRRNKGEITRAVICVIKIDNRLHTSSHSSETFAAGMGGRLLLSSQKFMVRSCMTVLSSTFWFS